MKPKMKQHGYFGIGCIGMKTVYNYGTLFRTAQIMGADFIFLIGCRFKRQASDTMKGLLSGADRHSQEGDCQIWDYEYLSKVSIQAADALLVELSNEDSQ